MLSTTKILRHLPRFYVAILLLIFAGMLTLALLPSSTDEPAQSNLSLDLSLKLQPSEPVTPTITIAKPTQWQSVTVKSGDNLSTLFARVGLNAQDVYRIASVTKKSKVLKTLFPGEQLDFVINADQLEKVRYIKNPLERVIIARQDNGGYTVETIKREPDIETRFARSVITSSLFVDGQRAGLSQKKLMELANIFGWDIDFALDIRQQDRFSLIFEEKFLDDNKIGEGSILAAQFINRGKVYSAIRHTDGNYYSPKGYSMRKAFLRSPVDFFRISSKYNPNRLHPVLKTSRPHRGVDYAAATGTPIKASGDGKVIWRATKGGYGRTVIIQHAGIYTTLYAHMSKYNSKVKKGSRVKQGQIIGYIGSSGLVTGPHLHYEFRINGVHKNPLKVKFPNVQPLNKQQMKGFKLMAESILAKLESYQLGTPIAAN